MRRWLGTAHGVQYPGHRRHPAGSQATPPSSLAHTARSSLPPDTDDDARAGIQEPTRRRVWLGGRLARRMYRPCGAPSTLHGADSDWHRCGALRYHGAVACLQDVAYAARGTKCGGTSNDGPRYSRSEPRTASPPPTGVSWRAIRLPVSTSAGARLRSHRVERVWHETIAERLFRHPVRAILGTVPNNALARAR